MSKKRLKYVYDEDDYYDDYEDYGEYEEYGDYGTQGEPAKNNQTQQSSTTPLGIKQSKQRSDQMKSSGGNRTSGAKRTDQAAKQMSKPIKNVGGSVTKVTNKLHALTVSEMKMLKEGKQLLNYIVVGHVDAGKSTLLGHLLYQLGYFRDHELRDIKKQQETGMTSKHTRTKTSAFSWLLDLDETERSKGVTIELNYKYIETENVRMNLIDAPGHKDFVPNLIKGVAQSDSAILVVPAGKGEFESSFKPNGQTREHTLLLRYFGVRRIIVVVNKMDAADYSQARFEEIKAILQSFFKTEANFSSDAGRASKPTASSAASAIETKFVPVSGLLGENVTTAASEPKLVAWYSGPSLLSVMEDVIREGSSVEAVGSAPMRVIVTDVRKGPVISGQIVSGFIKPTEKVKVYPEKQTCKIKAVHSTGSGENLSIAYQGDSVDLSLSGIEESMISIGSVLRLEKTDVDSNMIRKRFKAAIITLANLEVPMLQGSRYTLYIHTVEVSCSVVKLLSCRGSESSQQHSYSSDGSQSGKLPKLVAFPRVIPKQHTGVVEIELEKSAVVEVFRECKELGRFLLRTNGLTVAAGVVLS